MNIPIKVKIGFKDYEVKKIDGVVADGNSVCYGTINYDDGDINLSTNYSQDQQKWTFIHECVHGIDDMVETELTEDQTRKFAKGLYGFIKDNPGIFKD